MATCTLSQFWCAQGPPCSRPGAPQPWGLPVRVRTSGGDFWGPRCPHGSFKKPTTSSRNELKVTAGNLRTWQRGGEGSGRREGGGKQTEIKPSSLPGEPQGGGAAGCTAGVPPLGAQPQHLEAPLRSAQCPPMCPKLSEQRKVPSCPQSHPVTALPELCPCHRDTPRGFPALWEQSRREVLATRVGSCSSSQRLPCPDGFIYKAAAPGVPRSLPSSQPRGIFGAVLTVQHRDKKVHRRAPKPRKLMTVIKKPSTACFLNPWHCH